ncbi:MAG: hypothetical protein QN183_05120 [Armatimonadota bacterium]|nr:hypothetical protein [Armatimonadota bacterium]MDR7534422.1 hypothetical protein [Armatimonadota bacterium]MDR7535729.1 hypothetical protein [Armatimonadota bacterium]
MPVDDVLVLTYGLLLGARHALEPDHLAAVSTMAAHGRSRGEVLRVAVAWGAGHATVVAAAGVLLAASGRSLPGWLAARADVAAGAVMILLGALTLARARRERLHVHTHAHAPGMVHTHFHVHRHGPGHAHPTAPRWMHAPLAAYLVGSLHGLAGSGAAVAAVAVAAPSPRAAASLGLFATGSLAGMVAVGALALWPALRASSRAAGARRLVQQAAGAASLAAGLLLVGGGR